MREAQADLKKRNEESKEYVKGVQYTSDQIFYMNGLDLNNLPVKKKIKRKKTMPSKRAAQAMGIRKEIEAEKKVAAALYAKIEQDKRFRKKVLKKK